MDDSVKLKRNQKSSIRQSALKDREALSSDDVEAKSRAIAEAVLRVEAYRNADTIMCYMDFRNEVRTGSIIADCLASGKRVAVPVIKKIDGIKRIVPYYLVSACEGIAPGGFGIPCPDTNVAETADPADIKLILVPGVAFSLNLQRIGFGKGYYDMFLPSLNPNVPRIGLAFEVQIVEDIPSERFDQPLDMIITESREILGKEGLNERQHR